MNILMIGASDRILRDPIGDVRERHIQYANRAGRLSMIVYSPWGHDLAPTHVQENLWIYPTRSRIRLAFPWDAYRIGVRICQRERIDLITTQDPFDTGLVGAWLKRRFRIPLEIQNHSDFFGDPHWRSERPIFHVLYGLGKYVIRQGDLLRVLNRLEKEAYLRMGIPGKRVRILPTPVNVERFLNVDSDQIQALRRALGLDTHEKVILWVGRMVRAGPNKRLNLWLQVARRVASQCANVKFLLVGDGPQRRPLEALVRELGLQGRVIFTGHLPHDQLPAYYYLGHVYLHTSSHEGFGKVLVEAQAAGTPIVAVRAHGPEEIVLDAQTGYLCDLDPEILAERVTRLLRDEHLRKALGRQAQDLARQRYNQEAMIEAIVGAWREAGFGSREGQ